MSQPIDKSLVKKIYTLVGVGVKTVDEMKRHVRYYEKNDLFAGQNPLPITNETGIITKRMWISEIICIRQL